MQNPKFLYLFLLLLLGELMARSIFPDIPWLEYLFKPTLMISLGIWYFQNTRASSPPFNKYIAFAIFASLLGDIFLLRGGGFLPGLAAFLLAHIAYIIAFYRNNPIPVFFQKDRLPWAVLVAIYGGILLYVLLPHLGAMQVPVVVYALTILTMILTALNRWKCVPQTSFAPVLIGAILFVLSDSLLAINKFVGSLPASGILIMATYAIGQYLIVTGSAKKNY